MAIGPSLEPLLKEVVLSYGTGRIITWESSSPLLFLGRDKKLMGSQESFSDTMGSIMNQSYLGSFQQEC